MEKSIVFPQYEESLTCDPASVTCSPISEQMGHSESMCANVVLFCSHSVCLSSKLPCCRCIMIRLCGTWCHVLAEEHMLQISCFSFIAHISFSSVLQSHTYCQLQSIRARQQEIHHWPLLHPFRNDSNAYIYNTQKWQ